MDTVICVLNLAEPSSREYKTELKPPSDIVVEQKFDKKEKKKRGSPE